MGAFYDYVPPYPDEQHARLVALRQLTSRGIPCILWAEDALCYVHAVPTSLFDQQILVPDELLESAAAILQEGSYIPAVPAWDYAELNGPLKGTSPFPKGIRLQHRDIPDDQPYKLEPLPGYILLLPQSYFNLDVRSPERLQSLVPTLGSSNAGIMAPRYHTFLEALVYFIMNPPTGLDVLHRNGRAKHDIFIGYLVMYRAKYNFDGPPPLFGELLPAEEDILRELQTEEARWYLGINFRERRGVSREEMQQFKHQKALTNTSGPNLGTLFLARDHGVSASQILKTHRHYSTFHKPTIGKFTKYQSPTASFASTCRPLRVYCQPTAATIAGRALLSASQRLLRCLFL